MFSKKKCPNCGAKNPKDSVACTKCGAPFALGQVEQQVKGREAQTPAAPPEREPMSFLGKVRETCRGKSMDAL